MIHLRKIIVGYSIVFGTLLLHLVSYFLQSIYEFFIQFICPKTKDISKDLVLITGGAGGLGKLMCIEFSKLGCTVVAWDINEDGLKEAVKMVKDQCGSTLYTYICDIGNRESIRTTAERTRREVGYVSILVNNAGVLSGKSITDMSEDLWERTFRINMMAHFWTTREFIPDMLHGGRGHLVYIVSSAGNYTSPGLSDYCASKAAGLSFCETLDSELTLCGINDVVKVTCVAPFIINTDLFKGCTLRYPFLTPHLEPDYVVQRIIAGILRDQKFLAIGRNIYWMNLLKSLVPTKGLMILYKFTGSLDVMKNYSKKDKVV